MVSLIVGLMALGIVFVGGSNDILLQALTAGYFIGVSTYILFNGDKTLLHNIYFNTPNKDVSMDVRKEVDQIKDTLLNERSTHIENLLELHRDYVEISKPLLVFLISKMSTAEYNDLQLGINMGAKPKVIEGQVYAELPNKQIVNLTQVQSEYLYALNNPTLYAVKVESIDAEFHEL